MKVTSLTCVLFAFLSCEPKKEPLVYSVDTDLWTDATSTYLPATAEWTNRAEVADLNSDNLLDIVFANGGNYSEPGELEHSRVFFNQGAGVLFREATEQIFGSDKFYARVIKARDINSDQIPDLVIGVTFQTQTQLLLGLGGGNFQNVTVSHLPKINLSIGDLELGDVDDDGDLDMVLADWGPGVNMENAGGRTTLWLNDGQGHFLDATPTHMPDILIQFSWDLELVDVDNDFDLDIAISCKRCGTSRLFVNDGKGRFANRRGFPAYTNNYEFEPLDVNGDGYLDVVTVNDGEVVNKDAGSRREHLFVNQGGQYFIDATEELWPDSENVGEDDNNVVFLDYDSDGDPDFLLSSLTGEDRLLINDGTGKFKVAQPVLKGKPTPLTLSLVLGDLNNDKKLDIVMGQGEGENDIEERIFLGDKLKADTAPPVISLQQVSRHKNTGALVIKARIHDNKSPNMPQDWAAVEFRPDSKARPVPMTWYGENLWKVELREGLGPDAQLCATDYCGNTKCVAVKE
jgi:FG-GAP-like repeat